MFRSRVTLAPASLIATALLTVDPAHGASQVPDPVPSSNLSQVLDSVARAALEEETIASFSVHVRRGSETVFQRAYGLANVGLGVPATIDTRYRLVGPGQTILATLIMQEVERGTLSLDDDVAGFLPDFPWQGRTVTVRQLLDASSGLPDYHYLGDAYESTVAIPKAPDEVTALFAGRPFLHEPGERQQWTISGFHLAGLLLEKVTGERFPTLLEEQIVQPLDLHQTSYCVGPQIIPDLATGYQALGEALIGAEPASPTTHPFSVSVCSSAGDVAAFYAGLREGRVLRDESFREMVLVTDLARKTLESSGHAMTIAFNDVSTEDRLSFSALGQLDGFRASVDYFPEDSLTLVVLQNTSGGPPTVANRLLSALLGIGESPSPRAPESTSSAPPIRDLPMTSGERARYTGTYRLRFDDPPPTYSMYERTVRVLDDNGWLMMHLKGILPKELLKQQEHTFILVDPSDPDRRIMEVVFTVENGRATSFRATAFPGGTAVRVGEDGIRDR